jgi:hypothetical protein
MIGFAAPYFLRRLRDALDEAEQVVLVRVGGVAADGVYFGADVGALRGLGGREQRAVRGPEVAGEDDAGGGGCLPHRHRERRSRVAIHALYGLPRPFGARSDGQTRSVIARAGGPWRSRRWLDCRAPSGLAVTGKPVASSRGPEARGDPGGGWTAASASPPRSDDGGWPARSDDGGWPPRSDGFSSGV